jgi:hypothetical protein
MQIAKRVYSLAQDQNDSALMIGAHRTLAVTLYFSGDFEAARQYAMRGVQLWRLGNVHSPVEEVTAPAVSGLCFQALTEWHFGEIASTGIDVRLNESSVDLPLDEEHIVVVGIGQQIRNRIASRELGATGLAVVRMCEAKYAHEVLSSRRRVHSIAPFQLMMARSAIRSRFLRA